MEEEQQLSFFLEWYDPQSDQLKPYVLHYHGDNTVEMVRCMAIELADCSMKHVWNILNGH